MTEHIINNDNLLAIIVRKDFSKEGIHFFTPDDFSQQLAYMKRGKDYVIAPHTHNPHSRQVFQTQEVLVIKSGSVRVDFYDEQRNYLESTILLSGDIILLAQGGHGFKMLEESEILEVKQGPYAGDADKTRFEPIAESEVIYKEPR